MTPPRPGPWTVHATQRFWERVIPHDPWATPGRAAREATYAGRVGPWAGWRWRHWVLVVEAETGRVRSVWWWGWWQARGPREAEDGATGDVSG
jgi:hypothetical protein